MLTFGPVQVYHFDGVVTATDISTNINTDMGVQV